MAKLYMKQKVFSIKDSFTVKDENENDKYKVEGKVFSLGKKLTIYDAEGKDVAYIQQKLLSFFPKFHVFVNGELITEIKKGFGFRDNFTIGGLGWRAQGDYFAHNYVIFDDQKVVASVSKKWISWGDSYELDINEGYDEAMVLAVILAVDAVNEQKSNDNVDFN